MGCLNDECIRNRREIREEGITSRGWRIEARRKVSLMTSFQTFFTAPARQQTRLEAARIVRCAGYRARSYEMQRNAAVAANGSSGVL